MSNYDLSAWPLFRSVIDENDGQQPKARSCFVVGPFDDADPDVRRHLETVWKYIVRPAMLDSDLAVRRIDPAETDGQLNQQVFDALLGADLVVAIVSFKNPNVFYQIALAQAAARPLILMVEDGVDIPFEPRGAIVLPYSIDTDAVFSAVNVRNLQAAISAFHSENAPVAEGFRGRNATPGASSLGGASVFDRSRQITFDQRMTMMREANTRIDIMGLANLALAMHPDMLDLLRSRTGQKIEVRILQCAPANPGIAAIVGARSMERLDAIKSEIDTAGETWRRIIESPEVNLSVSIRRMQSSVPQASAIITDKAVVATPYMLTRPTDDSPTLAAAANTVFHRVMQQEFDQAWSEAATFVRVEPRPEPRPQQAPANANVAQPVRSAPGGDLGLGNLSTLRGMGPGKR